MKTDPLENFVRKNREGFDFLEPSPNLFEKIVSQPEKTKKRSIYPLLMKSALATAIFVAGFFVSKSLYFNDKTNIQSAQYEKIPALNEARLYYTNAIDEKFRQILVLSKDNPQIEQELKSVLSDIEEEYKVLSNDLNDNVMNQEIIEAMIQSYRLKLEIMEDMLDQMKSVYENEKGEEELHYEI